MECEMVILPKGASQCPICLDTRFPTLDLSTFFYHASRCEFCSILYKSTLDDAKVESIRDGSSKYDCPLCGQISGGKKEEVSTALVAGAVDLARALMIFEKDEDTFNVVFHEWFKIPGTGSKVSDVVEYLLEVTVSEPHKAVLDRRLEVFLEGWKRKLPAEGAAFKFG